MKSAEGIQSDSTLPAVRSEGREDLGEDALLSPRGVIAIGWFLLMVASFFLVPFVPLITAMSDDPQVRYVLLHVQVYGLFFIWLLWFNGLAWLILKKRLPWTWVLLAILAFNAISYQIDLLYQFHGAWNAYESMQKRTSIVEFDESLGAK